MCRTSRAVWPAAPSTTKGCAPAAAPLWKTAYCAAISSAAIPHASSACRPPATRAARTTSSSNRANWISTDCCARCSAGLLVTELLGHGVNPVTGDYSRGAAGFWVEHGEIQYPVEEITIAGNLKDMYRYIVAVGNDVLVQGSRQCGSVLIENMMVAGR